MPIPQVIRLEGYDTFSDEWYPLDGTYQTREQALGAARERLRELERTQPYSFLLRLGGIGVLEQIVLYRLSLELELLDELGDLVFGDLEGTNQAGRR